VSSDTVASLTQAFDSKNAGPRTLTVTGYVVNDGNGGANYTVATNTAAGTITPALLTLDAVSDSRVYNGNALSSATPTVVSGLVSGDTVSSLSESFDSKNAGPRTLTVTGYVVNDGNGGANYTVATNSASGSISPASLVITADDKTRTTVQPNPPLTASYSGFVAAETPAVLTGALSLTTPANANSLIGAYPIVAAGQTATNYSIRYVNGILTVLPAPALFGSLPAGLGESQWDAYLMDRAPSAGALSAECQPPTPNERLCAGWPVCEVRRPACEKHAPAEPGQ
jgi:hypothetical protein